MKTPQAELDRLAARYRRDPKLRRRITARTRKYRLVARMLEWWRINVSVPPGPA